MKKNFKTIGIFLAAAIILCCTGCSNIRNIRISSAEVTSISIRGLSSLDAGLDVTVDNPSRTIEILSAEGIIFQSGKELGTFSVEPLTIPGRSVSTIPAEGNLRLTGLSPLAIMAQARDLDISVFSIDLKIKARFGKGPAKNFTVKNIPLEQLIKSIKK